MDAQVLELLNAKIAGCTACRLHEGRTQTVPGNGDPNAELMFIGEAPGANEDQQGLPFVGRAGQLLDELLGEIGFTRPDVFVANVIKCRPPSNRDPMPDEIGCCEVYLREQIEGHPAQADRAAGSVRNAILPAQREDGRGSRPAVPGGAVADPARLSSGGGAEELESDVDAARRFRHHPAAAGAGRAAGGRDRFGSATRMVQTQTRTTIRSGRCSSFDPHGLR